MKTLPRDQTERDRFAEELGRNFSVIAAAGAGKTTAITERIVQVAKRKPDWLPRLVVVTFTNRAADDMQQRARQRIFESGVPLDVLTAFNRVFFGTIHSFCTKLLAAHSHHLGLAARLDLISDDEELWNEFVQRTDSVGESLTPDNRKALSRHVQLRDLMELGRSGRLPLSLEQRDRDCPKTIEIAQVLSYSGTGVRIEADKEALRQWKEQFESDTDFLPLIQRSSGAEKFSQRWEEAFAKFHEWMSCCALKVAAEVQANYRQFRAERGVVTFDDQIALALRLTENAAAIARIRAQDYIVILDEAQDTDPQQFAVLTEITRPLNATGRWLQDRQFGPQPGRFCMVGDFEQSIYSDRADLHQYRRVHDALVNSDAGGELKFSVTFRLDQRQVDFVNESFRDILNGNGQVDFIELVPRPERLPGQVVRLDISPEILARKAEPTELEKARAEAKQLAEWLAQTGCERLRARGWEHVAILCPRKKWFAPIADALRKACPEPGRRIDPPLLGDGATGIDSQVQSETDVKADSPAHAWLTALLTIMTRPRCGFEIVGVLREVFGISDHDLATFCERDGERFQIERRTGGKHVVAKALDLLAAIHAEIANQPMFTAVERIVEATRLRERLRSLPAEDFEGLDRELDALLQSAAQAEADGATLKEFAELLRANFTAERETTAPRAGAIQLITCQKAKGLEWDAVIVPFFARHVHTLDDNFPRIIIHPRTREAIVAFSKADVPAETAEALARAQTQEMERLLYVAMTRARHTLVLAADRELFAKKDRHAPSASLTTWLRVDQGQLNEPQLAGLEMKATSCADTSEYQKHSAHPEDRQAFTPLPTVSVSEARRCADDFARILNPSTFTPSEPAVELTGADKWKERELEFREITLPGPALRYGVWWHEFARQIDWVQVGPTDAAAGDGGSYSKDWEKIFAASVTSSPDPARSKREWEMLQKHLATDADFRRRIAATIVHPEMPFFFHLGEASLEGIVDLALFNGDKALILDWKTNRIPPDKTDNLRALYRPQIAAYWKAVIEMTGCTVAAGIYSTSTGQFIEYDFDELANEWERIVSLATEQLLPSARFTR
jgi:ATP-dependent exoDNAse (exonuclease V) beta subunit